MPLPIAHSLAGVAIYQVKPVTIFKKKWKDLFFLIFVANIADIDFLPGFFLNDPNRYHHEHTHTILGGIIFTGIVCIFLKKLKKEISLGVVLTVFLTYCSHLLLDFLTQDYRDPLGIMLFWPFSKQYFLAQNPVFMKILRSNQSSSFFQSIFNLHNLKAIQIEMVIMGIVILIIETTKKIARKCFSKTDC